MPQYMQKRACHGTLFRIFGDLTNSPGKCTILEYPLLEIRWEVFFLTAIHFISLGRRLANLYGTMCAPICRRHGINQTGFDILLFLANNPEHNTAHDLTAVRGIKRSMASVSVETLIQAGFLVRVDDPQDRRVHRLIPTETALPVIQAGQAMQEAFSTRIAAGITESERDALKSIIGKLETNLSGTGAGTDPTEKAEEEYPV